MKLHHQIDNNQILEIFELIHDKKQFLKQIKDIEYEVELPILRRLNKWFEFLNANYSKAICFYSQTISALLYSCKKNEIFRTQTTHEFELSLKFYKLIFDSDLLLSIGKLKHAYHLLSISLVFGKYPGMALTSITKSIEILKKGATTQNLDLMFESLFIKYEKPTILTNNIFHLSSNEVEAIMFINQGNNIRNYSKLPYRISKKESFLFIKELPDNLIFKNHVLERAIVCCKLLSTKSSKKELLPSFLSCSKTFEHQLTKFYSDIEFWKSAFVIISNVIWGNNHLTMKEYLDYFEYRKYLPNETFTLKGRTAKSITQSILDWHETADFPKNKELINLKWGNRISNEIKIKYNSRNYSIKEITEGKELFLESQSLKHCVFSYIKECYFGYSKIYSLRKEFNSIYYRYMTIEVQNNTIVQIAGKRNRRINKVELNLVKKWGKVKIMSYVQILISRQPCA